MTRAKQTAGGKTRRNRERQEALSRMVMVISLIILIRQKEVSV